jgi:hypothetical protein
MATLRYYPTATRLLDGRVLVAGGAGTNVYLAGAELYNPAGNGGVGTFAATGSMATARSRATATRLPDGRVLIVGGDSASGSQASAELYVP